MTIDFIFAFFFDMNRYRIIDLIRNTEIVKKYDEYLDLLRSPYVREQALMLQQSNLKSFLKRLRTNPFYAGYLKDFSDYDLDSIPYQVLKALPLSDKSLLKQNASLVRNSSIPAESGYTGGSTGSPFHYYVGKKQISSLSGFTMALWSYFADYSWEDEVVVIGGSSLGDKASFIKKGLHFLQRRTFVSGGNINLENAVKFSNLINDARKPIIVYAYPSSLCQYITLLNERGITVDKAKIKSVLTTSETLSNTKKTQIELFFGKKVINLYGARDGGISAGSSDNDKFIYNGIDCVAEVLCINGNNELVLTNLDSDAFPFVRYRVGDIAEVSIADTGYPFILSNLLGRTRDIIHIDRERFIHGVMINKLFEDLPISEFQVIQHKDFSCDFYLQLNTQSNIDLESLSNRIGLLLDGIPFRVSIVSELVRQQNNKLRSIISEVEA